MIQVEPNRTSDCQSTEDALRESELKWRQLAETAPDIIISIGPDGKILFINRTIAVRNKEDVVGKEATNFVPPDQVATLTNALKKVFTTASSTEYEIMSHDSQKRPAWYSTRIAPVIIDGKVVSATLITRDITERKRMEEELRQSRDLLETKVQQRIAQIQNALSLLEATFESTVNGLMVMDLNRRVTRFNKNFQKIWNFPDDVLQSYDGYKVLNHAAGLVVDPEELKRMTEAVYANPMQKSVDIIKLKDGRIIERLSLPQILDKKIIGRVWSYQDVTSQLRSEASREKMLEQEHQARLEAEKSIRLRDDFLALASHELRTPLTPLKMYLDWFKREARKIPFDMIPKARNLLQALDFTDREVERLIRLTDDLLDASRITAGRLLLNKEPMNLVELVYQVRDYKIDDLKKRNCEITIIEAGPVTGAWDYNRLEQVFKCLLSNAMKYGAGKAIRVSVLKEKNKAKLSVEDHGIGIHIEEHEKIFERFERANSIKNFEGLGLGLFISREIIQAHGGTITVKSEIGKGSTFTVSLPC